MIPKYCHPTSTPPPVRALGSPGPSTPRQAQKKNNNHASEPQMSAFLQNIRLNQNGTCRAGWTALCSVRSLADRADRRDIFRTSRSTLVPVTFRKQTLAVKWAGLRSFTRLRVASGAVRRLCSTSSSGGGGAVMMIGCEFGVCRYTFYPPSPLRCARLIHSLAALVLGGRAPSGSITHRVDNFCCSVRV